MINREKEEEGPTHLYPKEQRAEKEKRRWARAHPYYKRQHQRAKL
jgi:hypothetical protein